MNTTIDKTKVYQTIFLILIGIDFYGLIPFDFFTNKFVQIFIYSTLLFIGIRQKSTKFHKNIYLIFIAVLGNIVSSYIFNGQGFLASFSAAYFVFHFSLFFGLYKIKPSIKEVEKAVIILSKIGLLLYFVQYVFLDIPILTTVTGWRTLNDYDLVRFEVIGETIMSLTFFMFLNRIIFSFRKEYLIYIVLALLMFLLHGYRSILIGVVIAFLYMYYRIYGLRKFYRVCLLLGIAVLVFYGLSQFEFLKNSLSFMSEKSSSESDDIGSNVRVMELLYFYNEYLQSPFEWIFGGGFLGNSAYGMHMQNIQDVGSLFYGRVNWVDLGFVGMSFVGGLVLVLFWLKLLLQTIKKVPTQYLYIGAFTIYIIASSITLNIGCTSSAISIECIALYMFMLVYKKKKNEKNSVLLK